MLKQVTFGEWLPDLADNVVTRAVNVHAISNGYAPAKGFQAITSTLAAPFIGGGSFIDSAGSSTLLACRSDVIYKYSGIGSGWSTLITRAATNRYRFAQFGDTVVTAGNGNIFTIDLI